MEARPSFQYADRVPVLFCLVPRYFAPILGVNYGDFLKDPEVQYYWQLQFAKYRIENIPEDFCQGTTITVAPYFDNVINASAFGAEIAWSDNDPPRALPSVRSVDDIDRLAIPGPEAGLWGKVRKWHDQMVEFASQTRIYFNGKEGRVAVAPPAIGGEGPHMIAVDLAGQDLYWWQIEHPHSCARLLHKITKGMIRAETDNMRLADGKREAFWLAEDSAQVMSCELFEKFCAPYDNALYEAFGGGLQDGRGMHMCGDSTHLLDALGSGLRISSFNLFGHMVEPATVADVLGGRTYLWGNIDPLLLLNGPCAEIKAAATKCIEAMAPCGGLLLGDGANICPGTPIENLAAVTEAAKDYGRPVPARTGGRA